jgi:hypothetical protein
LAGVVSPIRQPLRGEKPVKSALEPTAEEDYKALQKLNKKRSAAELEVRRAEAGEETRRAKEKLQKIDAEWEAFNAEFQPRFEKRIAKLTSAQKEAPTVKLNPRQEKEFQQAAAKYIQQTKTPEQALEYLAGDLYAKENTTEANRFKRGLSPDQMEIVNRKIAELKQYEARGNVSLSRRNAEQKLRRAELAQNEEAIAAAQEELKKIA